VRVDVVTKKRSALEPRIKRKGSFCTPLPLRINPKPQTLNPKPLTLSPKP